MNRPEKRGSLLVRGVPAGLGNLRGRWMFHSKARAAKMVSDFGWGMWDGDVQESGCRGWGLLVQRMEKPLFLAASGHFGDG